MMGFAIFGNFKTEEQAEMYRKELIEEGIAAKRIFIFNEPELVGHEEPYTVNVE